MGRKRKNVTGVCHLCGENRELTYEHVPPQSAFNSGRLVVQRGQDIIRRFHPYKDMEGEIIQGGVGDYTLCDPCNLFTGNQYVTSFKDWTVQGMDVLSKQSPGRNPLLAFPYRIKPLRVLKEIVAMFMSANDLGLVKDAPELTKFVLHKEQRHLPPQYRFFVYFSVGPYHRMIGRSTKLIIATGETWRISEIGHTPFSYVMALDGKDPGGGLAEITDFASYCVDEKAERFLKIPLKFSVSPYPVDFRSREEMLHEYYRNPTRPQGPRVP